MFVFLRQENAEIFQLPSKLIFALSNLSKDSKIGAFIRDDPLLRGTRNSDNVQLALFLLHEKHNPKSFWKPYIGRQVAFPLCPLH